MSEHPDPGFGSERRVILIVVDEPAKRVLFNRFLKKTHHHLVFADNGEDGFDRFGECKPELVIVEVDIERLDGTILCQLIRQQPGGEQVPVVLLSADFADVADPSERLSAVGADAYLPLPFEEAQLRGCLLPLIEVGRPSSAAEAVQERPLVQPPRESTEVAFGSVLADFLHQTDEAQTGAAAAPKSGGSATAPPARGSDMDTVVSFKNPFYEGEVPTSLEIEPIPPAPLVTGPVEAGAAMIEPPLGLDEPPTPVGRRTTELTGSSTRISSDLSGDGPVTELAASPSGSTSVAAVTPLESKTDAAVESFGRPAPSDPRPDPLEEPKITGGYGSGIRPRADASPDSALIRELPKDGTPSGASDSNRASQINKRSGGQRRGLDESQLGKRLSKRVRNMFRLIDEVDYYQLLGVERGAEIEQLRRAYFDLSLEFHPDRFFLLRSGDLKEKIYLVYRRIAEAYRVLSDDRRRQAYDEARSLSSAKRAAPELRGDSGAAPATPPAKTGSFAAIAQTDAAERFIALAHGAFERQDFNNARLHLAFARAYEPDNATLDAAERSIVQHLMPTL